MEWLIPAIAGIVAAATSWLTVRASRKKTAADASEVLTGIAVGLVTPLEEQVDKLQKELCDLEQEVKALKKENKLLHRWAQLLYSQVLETGNDPISFERVHKLDDDGIL